MTEPLLAVILATSSSRGSNVVFRWPNNPKLFKRYSKVKYYADKHHSDLSHDRAHSGRAPLDDDLDPTRQKAKWDDNDEDDEIDGEHSDAAGQSDTPSSSDAEYNSDASFSDQDEMRSTRTDSVVAPTARTKTSASGSRNKSRGPRPLQALEEATPSIRSADPSQAHTGNHNGNTNNQPDSEPGGTSHNLSPEEKARQQEKAAHAYRNYLGYDIDFLASILSPRPELAHQKFEVVIDDLAFLGHPVGIGPGGQWGSPDQEHSDAENGDEGSERGRSRRGPNHTGAGPSASTEANGEGLKPSASMRSLSQARTENSATSSTRSLAPLTQFHLVLVLDRPDPSPALAGMELSSWLQLFYDNIVFKMTAALFAEQVRADYVSKESEKLLALRERCMDDGQSYSAYTAQCLGLSSLARCLRDMHKSIGTSSDAFLTINDRIEVHLQLPPILQDPAKMLKIPDIETELDPNDPIFLSGGGFAGMGKEGSEGESRDSCYDRLMSLNPHDLTFEEWTRTTGPYLLPWKTLLLLHDHPDDAANRGRSGGATPTTYGIENEHDPSDTPKLSDSFEQFTRKFTALFRPKVSEMLNLSEVADVLGWDLYEDVYPMVRHLIYYRQARVIDVPRTGHVYSISPLFDLQRLHVLSRLWMAAFPDLQSLPAFLSALSSTLQPLNSHFPGRYQRQLCLDVLIWLLRQEVVVKLHVRLRLVATEGAKRRAVERRAERLERRRKRRERRIQREAKKLRRKRRQVENHDHDEQRGRSRERDRSRSADTRRSNDAELNPSASGLSVTRPSILADSPTPGSSTPSDNAARLHRHGSSSSQQGSSTPSTGKPTLPVETLKFERRPVLRSRSPSTAFSVSFSNSVRVSEPGGAGARSRAGTGGSSSSGGGGKFDMLSMTPSGTSQPGTPHGRAVPGHVDAEGNGTFSRKGRRLMSRSPSRARMTIRGFGFDSEVVEVEDEASASAVGLGVSDEARRLSLVGEEEEHDRDRERRVRRISVASERPDIPPPSVDSPSSSDADDDEEESSTDDDDDDDDDDNPALLEDLLLGETLIVEPSRASRLENEWIASMVEGRDPWLVKKLFRYVTVPRPLI